MKLIKIIGIILTIILHLIVILLLIWPKSLEKVDEPPNSESIPKPFMVKLLPPTPPSITTEVLKGNTDSILYPTDEKICEGKDRKYTGIGIIWMPGSGMVVHAPEFYPAYKAGVRMGDLIVGPIEELDGYVDFTVMRSNNRLNFHVKLESICFDEE